MSCIRFHFPARRVWALVACEIVLLCCGPSRLLADDIEKTQPSSEAEQLDALFRGYYEEGTFHGAVLIQRAGSVVYQRAWGQRAPDGKQALTLDSAFYIASLSKQFTSMAVMMLEQAGRLSYSDKLATFFPDFPVYARRVSLHHLLTHTAGVADYYRLLRNVPEGFENQHAYELLKAQPKLGFEPGSAYEYSNGGYLLLAMVIEKVSGMSYAAFLKSRIFDPLEMKRSFVYEESTPEIANRAVGMTASGRVDDYRLLTTGAGGIFSTVGDLAKWDEALHGNKLVSADRLERAFRKTPLAAGRTSHYGYGWWIQRLEGRKIVSHRGSRSGYRANIRRDLSRRETVIMLTNMGGPVARVALEKSVERILQAAHSRPADGSPGNTELF